MNHRGFKKLISLYVDSELDTRERTNVEKHLRVCDSCSHWVNDSKTIRKSIRTNADISLNSAFVVNVMRALRRGREVSANWSIAEFMARRIVLALTVIVLFLLGLASFNANKPAVSMERYLTGEVSDSAESQILFTRGEISKDDVLMAAVSRH